MPDSVVPLPRWMGAGLIGAAVFALLPGSWAKWPDVLVDFGQQLYIPWQLAQGKVLYRDIAYLHGPFSQYLNSVLFRVFGPSLLTLAVFNIAVVLCAAALLRALFSRAGGPLSGVVAGLLFVSLFAFGQYIWIGNYNFVSPYVHELPHGVLLSLAGVALLSRHQSSGGVRPLAAAGFALGLNFLTKAETFVAGALASGVFLVLIAIIERVGPRRLLALAGTFCAGLAVPLMVSFALFATAMPAGDALDATLGPWRPSILLSGVTGIHFFQAGMGFDRPWENTLRMLASAGCWALLLAPAAVLALRVPPRDERRVAVAAFAAVSAAALIAWKWIPWLAAARPLPLAMLAVAAAGLVALRRGRDDREAAERLCLRVSLAVLGLGLLLKILLVTRLHHYGFALAMPATLVGADALVDAIPRALARRGGSPWVFRAAALAALLAAVLAYVRLSAVQLGSKRHAVGHGTDLLFAGARGPLVTDALARLGESARPGETLAVLPEGAMLNFLSRRVNPTPYTNFMPPEIVAFGEDRMLAAFQAHPPDLVFLVHKDTTEFGFPLFGRDYGRRLGAWIHAGYRPVALTGNPPLVDVRSFGILLLRRSTP